MRVKCTVTVISLSEVAGLGFSLEMVEAAATIIGLIGGLFAVCFGLYQYRRGEKWKRSEYLRSLMSDFFYSEKNHLALLVLDYDGHWVDLFPEWQTDEMRFGEQKVRRFQRITYSDVEKSLNTTDETDPNFGPVNEKVREAVDHLLEEMEKLNLYIKNGIFKAEEIQPFISWYMNLISGKDPVIGDASHIKQLRKHILKYGYINAREFIERFDPQAFVGIEG